MTSIKRIFINFSFLLYFLTINGIAQTANENRNIQLKDNFSFTSTSTSNLALDRKNQDTTVESVKPEGVEKIILNLPSDWSQWGQKIFSENNIPLVLGLSALTFASIKTDYQTWEPLHKLYYKDQSFKNLVETSVFAGDGKFQFGISAGFAAYGFMFHDNKALRTAEQTAEVILACGAVVQLMKHITGRERPEAATTRTGKWTFLPNQVKYHKRIPSFDAFPSGHLATATATLVVIMENYPEQTWIKYAGYPILVFVSLGLVAKGMHWFSDFPLAFALGYSFGEVVTSKNKGRKENTEQNFNYIPRVNITLLNNCTPGINLAWKL
jgi:membrane-associated phospholipid phosphatase